MKKSSKVLQAVDPGLRIVSTHRTGRRGITRADWDKAGGAVCPRCGLEAVRFRTQDGVCLACVRSLDEKQDRDEKKHAKLMRQVKAHNARIGGRR